MASLSSVPRRGVTVTAGQFHPSVLSLSLSVPQRRNHWIYHHLRRVAFSRPKHPTTAQPTDGSDTGGKPACYRYSHARGVRWGWGGGDEAWRAQKWMYARGLSSVGRGRGDGWWGGGSSGDSNNNKLGKKDGGEDVEGGEIDPITNRQVARQNRDDEEATADAAADAQVRSFISDFLAPDYEARFLTWKEKEQKKLLERLRKEFEEQEKELLKRQRKEAEEYEKREKKLWEKERHGHEKNVWDWGQELDKKRERERQARNAEMVRDEARTVPHPVPVLHPYSQVPISETEMVDGEGGAEGRMAFREQKDQLEEGGVEEVSPPTSLVVEAGGEGLVDPVDGVEATVIPTGVDPLNQEGLIVTQASDSFTIAPPVAAEQAPDSISTAAPISAEEVQVPQIVLPDLSEQGELPNPTQLAEEKLGEVEPAPTPEEVGDAPLLVESTGNNGDQGPMPVEPEVVVAEVPVEVSEPNTEGGPMLVPEAPALPESLPPTPPPPPPPPPEVPANEPVIAVAPPSAEPTPVLELEPPLKSTPSEADATLPTTIPESLNSELTEIKANLTKFTTVVTNLEHTMDTELNSILIQLRLWRGEVEKLAATSTSGLTPPSLFIQDAQDIPEAQAEQSGPVDYKILTLSPSPPPFHLLTTDLKLANANYTAAEGGNQTQKIAEFLPKLKEPYLFLPHVPKLTAGGWQLVSGGEGMLMFARKAVAGAGAVTSPAELDGNTTTTTAVIPASTIVAGGTTEVATLPDEDSGSTELKTIFSSPSRSLDTAPEKQRQRNYNPRDHDDEDGHHLHFYGHSLGGIAGDSISFSSVAMHHPRVNPIDMTTITSHPPAAPAPDTAPAPSQVDDAERSRWDEKRGDAVRSMRAGLALGEKAQQEDLAASVELAEDGEGSRRRMEAEEDAIRGEIRAVDGVVHGQVALGEAIAREAGAGGAGFPPPPPGEGQQQQQLGEGEKEGEEQKEKDEGKGKGKSRAGRFFRRLRWTVIYLGAGWVLVKEVGYWTQSPDSAAAAEEERKKAAAAEGQGKSTTTSTSTSTSANANMMGRDGVEARQVGGLGGLGGRETAPRTMGEREREGWGAGGGGGGGGARPGSRYSWSERDAVVRSGSGSGSGGGERWGGLGGSASGSGSGSGSGGAWGAERK